MFTSSLVYVVGELYGDERAWIDQRNYPGGPIAWIEQKENDTPNLVALNAAFATLVFAEALLCFAVWSYRWKIIILPSLIYLASIVMYGFFSAQALRPDNAIWERSTVNLSQPYFVLVMSFNVVTSTLLVSRLLYVRRQTIAAIGPEHARVYTTAAAIIVESALPFSIYSFVLVVLYGLGNHGEDLLLPLFVQLEAIVSEIIILRVVRGRGWTRSTATDILTSVAFHHPTQQQSDDPSVSTLESGVGRSLERPSPIVLHDLNNDSEEKMRFDTGPAADSYLHVEGAQMREASAIRSCRLTEH
ncbi:hypothetical protein EVJ58_g9455 [Rhodofomes roseus]|uniref:Uncharacterized protein n=1 Tax=Rhodofomes roseus TaxID=34475 RepID=A0A4Y9XVQ0_9APHY|nr:hypothetical protein EVJ58_g9455 [Rhodofomes roseus]